MSESTDKGQFMSVESYLSQSWAEATEEEQSERETKPKTAWAAVPAIKDDAPSLATIVAEEEKKKEAAAKKQPYRPPAKTAPTTTSYEQHREERSNYGESPRSYDRTPREKQAVPSEPPFTAFIGNLSYDVTEDTISEFFGELGVESVRLMKDPATGKPKGFGYIEFRSKDGLENALKADNTDFHGRALNMDVAKPQQSRSTNSWGPGNREGGSSFGNYQNREGNREGGSSFGNYQNREGNRSSFGRPSDNNFRDRPSDNNRDSNRYSFGRPSGRSDSRPGDRPTERPKLNINPPTQAPTPQSHIPPSSFHEVASKPKGSYENPFGAAAPASETDFAKMNQKAIERALRDKERDAKKAEELQQKVQQTDRKFQGAGAGAGAGDSRPIQKPESAPSWRTGANFTKPAPANFSRRDEPREVGRPVTERKPKPSPLVDSDGFTQHTGTRNRGWENSGQKAGDQKQTTNKPQLENRNLFSNLEEEDG